MVMQNMDKLSDEVLAAMYRDRRNLSIAYYEELLRRGYRMTYGEANVRPAVPTNQIKIIKTISTVKEL